jgi:hypothetical protein
MADQAKKTGANQGGAKGDDAKRAAVEYESEMAAVRAKTERLRAMRMARDAAAPPPPPKPAPKKKAAGGKTEKRSSATLSQWLEQQERGGHKS